jgi:hypothetical protein
VAAAIRADRGAATDCGAGRGAHGIAKARHRLAVGGARQGDTAKAHGAPEANHPRVGQHVGGGDRAHEMRRLIHGRHRAITAVGGEDSDHHCGIGKRH